MFKFSRDVNYYETDMMQIVHHSNYFRYFEEARIAFLANMGYPYHKLESEGIISPVVSISCDYLKPITFGDTFVIHTTLETITATKFIVKYEIYVDDVLTTIGTSKHCYINPDGKIISIKKANIDFYNALLEKML